MPGSPDLIVGLVTHPGSRFRAAGEKTLHEVVMDAQRAGVTCDVVISDRNDADQVQYPIDRSIIVASGRYQAHLEERWRRYHTHTWGGGVLDQALTIAMAARRSLASPKDLIRLLNIDLSHLRVWRTTLALGARAALVLEDDAALTTSGVGVLLADVMTHVADADVMVNCSRSFDPHALGIDEVLHDAPTTPTRDGHLLRRPARAITNTVCANLYSATFLDGLIAFIDRQGLIPVAPIDWRVNEYLMDHPETGTWWLDPPPFEQGSMQA
jgi:hypothetical protein